MISSARNGALVNIILGMSLVFCIPLTNTYGQGTQSNVAAGLAPGSPAGSYPLSGFETINPYSGNLNFSLPLMQVAGRGGMTVPVKLTINQKWAVTLDANQYEGRYYNYVDDISWNSWFSTDKGFTPGRLVGRHNGHSGQECPNGVSPYNPSLTRLTFITPDGTEHDLVDQVYGGKPFNTGYCNPGPGSSRGTVFVSTDGSHATFISDSPILDRLYPEYYPEAPSGYLMMADGTRYRIVFGQVRWQRDRNGNKLTFEYENDGSQARIVKITDSLNREIHFEYEVQDGYPYGLCDKITYKGFGGAPRTIRVSYKSLSEILRWGYSPQTGRQLFPDTYTEPFYPGGSTVGQYAESVWNPQKVAAVWLPDGIRSYQLRYNSYGELARVELPTGGAIEYDWTDAILLGSGILSGVPQAPGISVYRRLIERRVYANGSTMDHKTVLGPPEWISDMRGYVLEDKYAASGALLGRTKHYYFGIFSPNALPVSNNAYGFYQNWRDGKEYQTDLYHSDGSTVLGRIGNAWSQTAPTWFNGAWDYAPSNNPHLTETTTTLVDTNQVSRKTFSYDQFGNLTDTYNYDYGVGAPGPLPLRRTHTDYLTTNPVNGTIYTATDIHIRNLPTQQSVFDSAGTERARTTYEYDYYAAVPNHAELEPRSGISGFDSSFTALYKERGNVTATTRYLLDASGLVTGSISAYAQYDIAGNVVKMIDAGGNATELYYSDCFGGPNGNAQLHSAPLELSSVGQVSFAFATSARNAQNHMTFTQMDYFTGRSVDVEDANGIVSSIYSDNEPLDRATKVIRAAYPSSSAKSQMLFVYDDLNRIVTTYNDQNYYDDKVLKSQTLYDGLGRTTETRTYEGVSNYIAVQQQYDVLGRPHKVSNPFRNGETPVWTTTGFDALGRIISSTTPDNDVRGIAYSGNRILVTDQALKQRLSQSDALDRLTDVWEIKAADSATEAITFPGHSEVTSGYRTRYAYDALDGLVSVTQQLGTTGTTQTRSFVYDSLKRLTSAANPESGTILYQYDNNSNVIVRTDARGVSTHFSYDVLNRPVRRWYNGSSSPSASINNDPALPAGVGASHEVNYSYDAAGVPNSKGRPTAVTSSVSSYSYSGYDALGRVLGGTQMTDGQAYTISYSYDLTGNLKSQTYPSGRIVSSEYDVASRLAGVKNQASGLYYAGAAATDSANRLQYTAHGATSQMRLGNGLWEHTNYNSRLQPTQVGLGTASTNSSTLQLDYGYGTTANNGNVLNQTITVPTIGGVTGFTATQTYTYDALNRLATAQENPAASWTQNFSYDRYGNRNFAGGTTSPAPLTALNNPVINPSNNRIDTAAGGQTSYSYDSAGNLTHDAAVHAFGYDAENKQTTYDGGATTNGGATYSYDGDGRRVKKVVGGATIVTTVFVYNVAGQLVAEYSNATPSGPGGTSYLTSDTLGSPRVITGPNQDVKARHDYRPFGEEIDTGTGGRASNQGYAGDQLRQKFTSKERDNETGLDYFLARYFSSSHGRFTSPDEFNGGPVELFAEIASANPTFYADLRKPQSLNKYHYALNNPLRYIDPDGHEPDGEQDQVVKVNVNPPVIQSVKVRIIDKLPNGSVPVGGEFEISYKYRTSLPQNGTKPEDLGRIEGIDYDPTIQNPSGGVPKSGGTFADSNNLGTVGDPKVKVDVGKEAVTVEKTERFVVKPRPDSKPGASAAINYKIVVTNPNNGATTTRSSKGPDTLFNRSLPYIPVQNVKKTASREKEKE